MTILALILGLQLSMGDGLFSAYEPPEGNQETINMDYVYFVTFNTKAIIYEYFYIQGSVKIPVYNDTNDYSFWPIALSSYFEGGVEIGDFILGWRHFCTHPVVPFYDETDIMKFYDESGSEFFIKYETQKLKIF